MSDDRARQRNELIAALLGPAGPELTCEQCFEQLDRYVDVRLGDGDPDRAVPGMHAHLTGCPACREDYDSLFEFVSDGDGHAPAPSA
jgi:hypothetical protein